jgi:RNA polymerase sigma factor (sigma-70 family)
VLDPSREILQDGRSPADGPLARGEASLRQVFEEHRATICKAAAHACRAYGLSHEEVQDFTQEVCLKILDDDCAVLRKFQGRCSLPTYLSTVVQKALQDHVNHLWGKWRPSAEARRLGPLALQLEKLLVRDRFSFGEACQKLWTEQGVLVKESELADLAARLPPRAPRRAEAAGQVQRGGAGSWDEAGGRGSLPRQLALAAAAETADERLLGGERARLRRKATDALHAALAALPAEDRLIARQRMDDVPVADIARHLHLDPKRLYKRKEKILATLRRSLESAGVGAADVAEILDRVDA